MSLPIVLFSAIINSYFMDILFIILLFLLGACVGSFLNVVIFRVNKGNSFIKGRSKCVNCKKTIAWYDLIPIISFVILFGKCRKCGAKLSLQYPIVEFLTAVLFVFGGFIFAPGIYLVLYFFVVCFFILLFVFDICSYIVPDTISLPAIVCIFALNYFATRSFVSLAIGGVFGASWFLFQFLVSRGRWVGGGDIRLGAIMGVLLGHPLIWLGLMVSYMSGSVIALFLIALKRKKMESRLPFATILLPATFFTWIFGERMWDWYVSFLGF